MTIEEAKALLSGCTRYELRDHYFGDREITWVKTEGDKEVEIAFGYAGPTYTLSIHSDHTEFSGADARELFHCGCRQIERNDTQGPDTYMGA